MKSLLICHDGAALNQQGIARWMASFSELVGIVVIREERRNFWQRASRELKRVGLLRFFEVIGFRVYYRMALARKDAAWEQRKLEELCLRFPELPQGVPVLLTPSPNSPEVERFIREHSPDIMLARCKILLKEHIFSIPLGGTFVLHPGICPEYRNSHGCFWALANGDLDRVGMTLLKINAGVDEGPVYGYFRCGYDEINESHVLIQHRVVFENLDALRDKLISIFQGRAVPINTSGRRSAAWGQPWLSRYVSWKRNARRRGELR